MSRGFLAIAISLLLHGVVLAALAPQLFLGAETAPPRAKPLSVQLVPGLPGQEKAAEAKEARNAGLASESETGKTRAASVRRPGTKKPLAEEEARRKAERARERQRKAAEAKAAREALRAEKQRKQAERAARAEKAKREAAERAARETRRRREAAAARKKAAEAAARRKAEQAAEAQASAAARAGESVPARFGVGSGRNPLPPYPETARFMGHEGTVVLRVMVRADGRSDWVRVVESSGYDSLDRAALRTVRERWRFEPARRGSEPVAAEVLVPIRFRLNGR